ncbi:hypothetical protein CEXT_347051 [Caerostris extrusa]|uniref:Uncharacterized protein n=1 Tax=Caerostris extrusa TaxID=172846 RepID=A0AAV4M9J9_CAEEX|nr:hypothetical protein CEXT_347051 [Caerostris extrusa]
MFYYVQQIEIHTRQLWVLTAPESVKCALSVQSTSVKPIVLLFHLIVYQIRKTSASRSQEVSVLAYVATCRDTVSELFTNAFRHCRTTLLSASKLLVHCTPHVQQPPTWIAPFAPLSWQPQRLLRDVHFFDVTPKNL